MSDTPTIDAAWVAALNELTDMRRDQVANVGQYSYKFATLDAVCKQAREVLSKHDLAVQQFAHTEQAGSVSITTTVWHESGQSIAAPPFTMPAKGGPQDIGSAITYARRYSLMAFLGLATDDDDGAGAQTAALKPDPVHPLSERVGAVMADMKALTDTNKEAIKTWADGRKLSGSALLNSEQWLEQVETFIDELTANGAES